MLIFGISVAAAVKISNALGAGCPKGARRATLTALHLTLALLVIAITALMLLRVRRGCCGIPSGTTKLPVYHVCVQGLHTSLSVHASSKVINLDVVRLWCGSQHMLKAPPLPVDRPPPRGPSVPAGQVGAPAD
jgi:hypothetical protein